MKVIAIDASSKSSGYAIFDGTKLIAYGCLTATSTDVIKRIQKIVNGLQSLMQEHQIEKVILEEVRPENGLQNIQTHRILLWLQAAIAFMVHDNFPKVQITYIYPSEWRKACGIKTGRGVRRESLKAADIQFVRDTYGIEMNDDAADATCIGHAYVNKFNNEINWE